VPLQPHGSHPPVFAVPGHNGDVSLYRVLAQELGNDQPFFGLQLPGLDDDREPMTSVGDLAAYFVEQILAFQPRGRYALAGYCAGATIAYEIAQQLVQQRAEVSFIAMFAGSFPPSYRPFPQLWERYALRLRRARRRLAYTASQSLSESGQFLRERLRTIAESRRAEPDPILDLRARLMRITAAAVAQYKPRTFAGRVCLFFPSSGSLPNESMLRWRAVAPQIEEYYGPDRCEGDVMLLEPNVRSIAELFCLCRDRKVNRV
jgi:thioesterase domain-containing protein